MKEIKQKRVFLAQMMAAGQDDPLIGTERKLVRSDG
jgi:hypothetical protein